MISGVLEKVIQKENLSESEATELMYSIMTGKLNDIQIAAFLVALRSKGETATEIGAFAQVMREQAIKLDTTAKPLIDTCGTGGDKSNLINISTLSAIVLAAMKLNVAKHGNRSVSSACGSADLLEHLGYPLSEDVKTTAARLEKNQFAFMFAPNYHPAMRFAMGARKELKIRTVFNILGPLSNPAAAEIQLLGVFSADIQQLMAEALSKLGVVSAMVVHSSDGLDELSPVAKTPIVLLNRGKISNQEFDPTGLGLQIKSLDSIKASSKEEAFEKADKILSGSFKEGVETVAINATAALYLYEVYQKTTEEDLQTFMNNKLPEVIGFIEDNKCNLIVEQWA